MATVGTKNQPLVSTTDLFQPNVDINTLANWVATNYASVKILTGATLHTAVTGLDLFNGLVVYETSTGQFWRYDGTTWNLETVGSNPRIELTNTTGTVGLLTNNTNVTLPTWTTTASRGSFSVASGVVTVPYTGRYNIWLSAIISGQTTASGTRLARVLLSTGAAYSTSAAPVNSQGSYMNLAVTGLQLTAATTITPQLFQTSGVALDWVAAATAPSKFIIEYIGA
jgi:hypothetical protein